MRALAIALLAALMAAPAAAQEKPVTLKKGAGLDLVEANCAACHSLDYIQMNSPFLTSAQWDASIAKMINVFGAPISEADARKIGDYLKANYGAEHVTENR
jgi:sulfite dehydrogenase (cytochrome) subunit B